MDLLTDLWAWMRERKKFWLAPIILVMILLDKLIAFAQCSWLTSDRENHGLRPTVKQVAGHDWHDLVPTT